MEKQEQGRKGNTHRKLWDRNKLERTRQDKVN